METAKTTPRDFFLHLGMMVALYVVAGNFINLLFKIINKAFPEVDYSYFSSSDISLSVATLIIVFPILLILAKFIYKTYDNFPEKKNIWVRRWLTYVTLFFAGIFLAGDLVTVLYMFLDGQDLTTAFLLKALTVLIVSGAVFGFYLQDIRDKIFRKERKIWTLATSFLLLASIIIGFSVIGSPKTQRLIREDNQKIADLQEARWQIINYWQVNGLIPEAMPNLPKGIEYDKTGLLDYELCTTFNRANDYSNPDAVRETAYPSKTYTQDENWDHGAGYQCFERKIDTIAYPTQVRG